MRFQNQFRPDARAGSLQADGNALAAQMVADSSDQTAMKSAPSEKTISIMNAINTMTTFQSTALPAVMKYVSNA